MNALEKIKLRREEKNKPLTITILQLKEKFEGNISSIDETTEKDIDMFEAQLDLMEKYITTPINDIPEDDFNKLGKWARKTYHKSAEAELFFEEPTGGIK
jgi:hypothetical protein